MNILLLETATQVCSVALSIDGKVTHETFSNEHNAHSTRLSLFIEELLAHASLTFADLHGVCVSSGPGSYTGLRIGVSSAKGICFAREIPLMSLPTLESMACQYYDEHPDYQGMVCPMIDARRMECYAAFFCREGHSVSKIRDIQADIIEENIYDSFLDKGEVVFVGDGAPKTQSLLGIHPNARFDDTFRISAAGLNQRACQMLAEGIHEDVAYFEPFYLKDFVAKKSVVRGLR